MDVSLAYAIAIGGIFCVLLVLNGLPLIARLAGYLSRLMSKYMVYRYAINRHRLLGPWSWAGILSQLIYLAGNIVCLRVGLSHVDDQVSTFLQAGLRAGSLAIVNLILPCASPHLGLVADLLGLNLDTIRWIHRSTGVMTVFLVVFHVIVAVASQRSFDLSLAPNLFAVMGASSLGCIVLLSIPILRRPSYEIFLRTHHAFSALSVYAIWRHVPSDKLLPRRFLYILVGLFGVSCVVQGAIVFHRNGFFRSGHTQACLTHDHGAIRLRLQCRTPLKVKKGQYINLWMPSVSFRSFLQSHPFVVISWSEKPQDALDLLIEPRRGLTRELLYHARSGKAIHSPVWFSGPHGKSVSMDGYENILMVASGFGITAQLPYLKQLIHGYNSRRVRARRVHLVWQVQDVEVTIAAQKLLNGALEEDTLDDGWILAISIYCESNEVSSKSFGKRASVYPGKAPLSDIFRAEVAREHTGNRPVPQVDWNTQKVVEGSEIESGTLVRREDKILVTVSATDVIRDELRRIVRDHLVDQVKFFELDYQPS